MSDTNGQKNWMIYGANGYTGELIAREAARRGLKPLLAGRNKDAVEKLAGELKLPYRIFSLGDGSAQHISADAFAGIDAVIHCAGPFSATARPMLAACRRARCHYMDITGEIQIFEDIFALHKEIAADGICAMPGVGFDVVPSDCLANLVCGALGEKPLHLEMAFRSGGGPSRGTAKTMIEKLGTGTQIRRDGKVVLAPLGSISREVPKFGTCVAIPWGDVASAYRSTGSPNISVFIPLPAGARRMLTLMRPVNFLLRLEAVRNFLTARVEKKMTGPTTSQRSRSKTTLWAEARSASGRTASGTLVCGDGYDVTVLTALACLEALRGGSAKPGAWTPAQLLGGDFIRGLPGMTITLVAPK